MPERELTRAERAGIRKLVVGICANYDARYGCLPLDYGRCYMLDKYWTGAYCKYFGDAVLPLDAVLQASLTGEGRPAPPAATTKPCEACGKPFAGDGRQRYCSPKCAGRARRKSEADRAREYRRKRRLTVTGMAP